MHLINQIYGAKFDFATCESDSVMDFMVATVPRSGSTQFCLSLWATQVLGAPLEYPNFPMMHVLRRRLGGDLAFVDYWTKVRALRTSPNGVFGYKMFMNDYLGAKKRGALECFTPRRVVYLRRSDLVAQAISYSRAMRSGAWFSGVPLARKPEYDAEHIRACCRSIQAQHDFWRRIFDLTKVEPLEVTYEEWLEKPVPVVRKVVRFVTGITELPKSMPVPELRVQRDDMTEDWKSRFEAEAAAESVRTTSIAHALTPLAALKGTLRLPQT